MDRGIASGEFVGPLPVGRGPAAVKQPGSGKHERAGALAEHAPAAFRDRTKGLKHRRGRQHVGLVPAHDDAQVRRAEPVEAGRLVLAGLAAATGELGHLDPGHISGHSWLALLYLIGPGSLLAMTCYVIALRSLPTATVSTYAYVNPVVAVALGALLLGERLTLVTIVGGAVVLVSVVLLLTSRSRQAA